MIMSPPEEEEADLEQRYRRLHEKFVSGNLGSSPWEVAAAGAPLNLSLLLFVLASIATSLSPSKSSALFYSGFRAVEFSLLTLPLLFGLTCCSDPPYSWGMAAAMAAAAAALWLIVTGRSKKGAAMRSSGRLAHERVSDRRQLPFVTNYRSAMLLTTAVCILAVDFPVFPRRHAKTENFGYGLMDIGVGSFVFAAGLVSQEARRGTAGASAVSYLSKSLMEALPMLALGLARLLSVKGSGYHEHVTEYGLHWNFFFTLAFSKVATSFFFALFPVSVSWPCALLLSLCHEACLSVGLADWVLSEDTPRDSLISANREGLCSVPGYVAIYLAGVAWGTKFARLGETFADSLAEAKSLGMWALIMWTSLFYSEHQLFLRPSRRLANWNYFNWMVAYNISLLVLFLLTDLLAVYCSQTYPRATAGSSQSRQSRSKGPKGARRAGSSSGDSASSAANGKDASSPPGGGDNGGTALPYLGHRVPVTFRAISKNGLAYFLLANILTGAANLALPTIHMASCPAVLVLTAYMAALHIFAIQCYTRDVKLKVW